MKDERIKKEFNSVMAVVGDVFGLCFGKVKIHCDDKKKY